MRRKIAITADCTCDLTDSLLESNGVDMIYFYILTDTGNFKDRDEITAKNVFECMERGNAPISIAPPETDYVDFFTGKLRECDEIIHICISSQISKSYENAVKAVGLMENGNERVHVVDSLQLSTGTGHLVLYAAEMARTHERAEEIIPLIEAYSHRISTTFIAQNALYLYKNNKVSRLVNNICRIFKFHPILGMRDGVIYLKGIYTGNYAKAMTRYVKKELKESEKIDSQRLFITHAGCSLEEISATRKIVEDTVKFEHLYVTEASATISSNCGPHTVGVLFLYNE